MAELRYNTTLDLFRLLFKSQLKHMAEWDEGLRLYHRKNMLIAELAGFLLSIDTDKAHDLLRLAAAELDPDAFERIDEGKLSLLADGETRMGEDLPRRIVVEDSAANLRSLLESAIRYERDRDPATQEALRKAQQRAKRRMEIEAMRAAGWFTDECPGGPCRLGMVSPRPLNSALR